MLELENRVFPVEGAVTDRLLQAARRFEVLRGYPPGKVEDWYYTHRFSFHREDPISAVDVISYTFPMGGAADFEWHAVGCMSNDLFDVDQPLPPLPTSGTLPSIVPPVRTQDPGAVFDLAFFSLNGTRPHQNNPVCGSNFRGGDEPGDGGGWPPPIPITSRTWGLPFEFLVPTFISRNDTIRCDVTNWINRSANFPVASTIQVDVDVTLIGIRFYDGRS